MNSVDVLISLNGIPLATLELKNQFTGQDVGNALKQYGTSRDNRELLFAFKKRTLVHFAVDQDEVYMTTKLDGAKTFWLPFNKGNNHGKGNPLNPDGYKTAYLWEEILQKDSWLEIIQSFAHLEREEYTTGDSTYIKEKLIFPRYHQLDAVRKITQDVLDNGCGKTILFSTLRFRKSNTIACYHTGCPACTILLMKEYLIQLLLLRSWVLDKQLQDTIYQFEHKSVL